MIFSNVREAIISKFNILSNNLYVAIFIQSFQMSVCKYVYLCVGGV